MCSVLAAAVGKRYLLAHFQPPCLQLFPFVLCLASCRIAQTQCATCFAHSLPRTRPKSWSKPEARARSPQGERPNLAQASIEFQDSGRHKGGLSQRGDRLSPVNSNGRVGSLCHLRVYVRVFVIKHQYNTSLNTL